MAALSARSKYHVERALGNQAEAEFEAKVLSNGTVTEITRREIRNLIPTPASSDIITVLSGTGTITNAQAILGLAMAFGSYATAQDVVTNA